MDYVFNDKQQNKYRAVLPYPQVTIGAPNQYYAKLISGAFAGKNSKMTAVMQYTAHSFFIQDYPEISTAYKYITAVEFTHLKILGNTIRKLGLRPVFLSRETNRYWNAGCLDYKYTVRQILASDIEGERVLITRFKRLLGKICDKSVQDMLKRLIMDEEKHIEILTSLFLAIK